MALRLIYQMFSKLLGRIVLRARSDTSKEIEILILRVGARTSAASPDHRRCSCIRWSRGRGTVQQIQF